MLLEWLDNGRIDMRSRITTAAFGQVSGDPLFIRISSSCVSKAKPRRRKIQLRRANIDFCCLPVRTVRELLEASAARLGVHLKIRFEVQSISVMKELVEQGVCATVLSYGAVARECGKGRLVATEIVNPTVKRIAYLAYSLRRPRSKAKDAVLAFIRELALKQKGVEVKPRHCRVVRRAVKDSDAQTNNRRNGVAKPRTALTSSGGRAFWWTKGLAVYDCIA